MSSSVAIIPNIPHATTSAQSKILLDGLTDHRTAWVRGTFAQRHLNATPAVRIRSATSRGGRLIYLPSSGSESRGLGVQRYDSAQWPATFCGASSRATDGFVREK